MVLFLLSPLLHRLSLFSFSSTDNDDAMQCSKKKKLRLVSQQQFRGNIAALSGPAKLPFLPTKNNQERERERDTLSQTHDRKEPAFYKGRGSVRREGQRGALWLEMTGLPHYDRHKFHASCRRSLSLDGEMLLPFLPCIHSTIVV